jgi:hypothetical protein
MASLAIVMVFHAIACGGSGSGVSPASLATATEVSKAPRRPDGVALEVPSALPVPVGRALASGVVALRVPPTDQEIDNVVGAYLRGLERADMTALAQMLTRDAVLMGPSRPGAGRAQIVEIWAARIKWMRSFDGATARLHFNLEPIETYTYDTVESMGNHGNRARPPSMRPGDWLVRVPSSRLVGNASADIGWFVLLLRIEDGQLRIAGDTLPER